MSVCPVLLSLGNGALPGLSACGPWLGTEPASGFGWMSSILLKPGAAGRQWGSEAGEESGGGRQGRGWPQGSAQLHLTLPEIQTGCEVVPTSCLSQAGLVLLVLLVLVWPGYSVVPRA